MFEKSLYDLIKGLRNHRGAEEEYVQNSIRECRVEIKSQDMDKKATAVLKLIYLEMFGYDMSWASFHVLEVMSSSKYLQKRVGYLGAVQSFRPDTEVLMLATNLLKKDIISSTIPNISLPIAALSHIITPSLASSLLADILPRLSHTNAAIRKKAVVCLYRIALVYPDALRLAWPKIGERLMDEHEDTSVTTAVINVVCEFGWRRPQDFLPLAPRLFELLVDGGNNWMAIKIIKLFASLTPLEPRLVRKLLRPLTNIIQTTSAMSLLYECINGIIQGGILDGNDNLRERDEVAKLCVDKLRGMIVIDGDPNLKYVALLAFNRIVVTHPLFVSMQQDVIMGCLEDADISIRLQALELLEGMVSSDTLQFVVNRLLDQIRRSPSLDSGISATNNGDLDDHTHLGSTNEHNFTQQESTQLQDPKKFQRLPIEYKLQVAHRILEMCSRDNYSELSDFEWYLEVLIQLIKSIPLEAPIINMDSSFTNGDSLDDIKEDIPARIGCEVRNIAVRVRSIRLQATRAAESLIVSNARSSLCSTGFGTNSDVLGPLAWVVGEFAEYLSDSEATLRALVESSSPKLPARTLSLYLQAIPKIFLHLTVDTQSWDSLWKSKISLLLNQVLSFLDTLSVHPDLDVQERAMEFLEILRLIAEAIRAGSTESKEPPSLLSSGIRTFFSGLELNSVAANAQKKVPTPDYLSLDETLNNNLFTLFMSNDGWSLNQNDLLPSQDFYYLGDAAIAVTQAPESINPDTQQTVPYQELQPGHRGEPFAVARRKAERRERNKDDPFYIGFHSESSGRSTPFYKASSATNGEELDVDSIPIVDLNIESGATRSAVTPDVLGYGKKPRARVKKFEIATEETVDWANDNGQNPAHEATTEVPKVKRSLLQVDSSGLEDFSLEKGPESREEHTDGVEMSKAMQKIEQFRLEMQRSSERIHLEGIPTDGAIVKKKKKKSKREPKTEPGTAASIVLEAGTVSHGDANGDGRGSPTKKRKNPITTKKAKKQQVESEGL
ncbi:hypothetical protein ASPZODRAFT_136898 [Penicilliopsis zonata CBS 506.65]|uniref:AP-3 complex subunit delta n=1 Tax=Penicilliopsis zonata CBS 506.65 TaxID=1073090 RepID=A0A1L9S791_9EURO|nr:hypothetical protein ASPZODRAFT_136898 [Penicilliopsis zonata CBS 506.65]OJJ43016.1 hypothetical protein ASPZODRAFT_136898 [Penicilliopsis zonata CBS 506.65]